MLNARMYRRDRIPFRMFGQAVSAFLLACVVLHTSTEKGRVLSKNGLVLALEADAVEGWEKIASRTCSLAERDRSGSCIDVLDGKATVTDEASTNCLERDCTKDDLTAESSLFENIKASELADIGAHQRLQSGREVLQLVRPSDSHDTLMVEMEALEALEKINDPVAFVSVAGPYHG